MMWASVYYRKTYSVSSLGGDWVQGWGYARERVRGWEWRLIFLRSVVFERGEL